MIPLSGKPGRPRIDVTGQRFGRLVAGEYSYTDHRYFCQCDCGGSTRTSVTALRTGHTRSCGCIALEWSYKLNRKYRVSTPCACGDHIFAPLTHGFITLVSPADAELLTQTWSVSGRKRKLGRWVHPYARGSHRKPLAKTILGVAAKGKFIDHKNGNTLDNRRDNLRLCTPSQNNWNQRKQRRVTSSKYKGVFYGVRARKGFPWVAGIQAHNVFIRLGSWATEVEAARAYDEAAKRLHGEFAKTNAMLGLL